MPPKALERDGETLTSRAADLLAALGLLGLLALVSLTAPRWARFFRQPIVALEDPAVADVPATTAAAEREAGPKEEAQRKISVKLFFEAKGRPGLVMEERTVPFSAQLSEQVKVVAEELIRGSQTGLVPTLDPQTKVLDVFVAARGVGYVDLSKEAAEGQREGSDAELLAVYSIVNSITVNFPSVPRVQILIDGHPAATLAGHVDISRPLPSDMTFLAASTLTPTGSAAEPAAGASPSLSWSGPSPGPASPPAAAASQPGTKLPQPIPSGATQ